MDNITGKFIGITGGLIGSLIFALANLVDTEPLAPPNTESNGGNYGTVCKVYSMSGPLYEECSVSSRSIGSACDCGNNSGIGIVVR